MDKDLKYCVALNTNSKIGPARFKKILAYFGNCKSIWNARRSDLVNAGLEEVCDEIIELRKVINPEKELTKLTKLKIKVISINDACYPKNLSQIHDPPALLYCRGELKKEDEIAVAVVGTRRMSSYGRQVTERICYDLAKAGVTIISGLALGVDSVAHQSTLEAGGKTIAVLAGGIDDQNVFPPHNLNLAKKIIQSGCGAIVSENHISMPSLKFMFPIRNRIISGLSLGVVVIEASEKSGALITAMSALDQNREVFAIPGNIFSPQSIGPNNLIKIGAKSVTSAQDILDELNIRSLNAHIQNREILPESKEEKIIFQFLDHEPKNSDFIIRKSQMSPEKVLSTLTFMEMKGMIKNIGGGNYIKIK